MIIGSLIFRHFLYITDCENRVPKDVSSKTNISGLVGPLNLGCERLIFAFF